MWCNHFEVYVYVQPVCHLEICVSCAKKVPTSNAIL